MKLWQLHKLYWISETDQSITVKFQSNSEIIEKSIWLRNLCPVYYDIHFHTLDYNLIEGNIKLDKTD